MHDIAILGAGPAGYVAALRAAQLGRSVLLIEKDRLGGVCLNSGCIPTKSLLYAAKLYDLAGHSEAFGVKVQGVSFDYSVAHARTVQVQDTLRGGIASLMKRAKVEVVTGEAKVTRRDALAVADKEYPFQTLLIATGSSAAVPPIPGLILSDRIVTHVGMLAEPKLPEHLIVIGGGVIGVEFASLLASAGRKVTVIEMLPGLCAGIDPELTGVVQKKLEKKGVVFHLNAKVVKVDGAAVKFTDAAGAEKTVEGDRVLVAAGRKPNVENLGLEAIGLDFDRRRGIPVDLHSRTNLPNVYAAGDVTGRMQLAHFASRQAEVAVENACGESHEMRPDSVPAVVYTQPEIASVGLSEQAAKERSIPHEVFKMPLGANGRFLAETAAERGICKVVVGTKHRQVLGVHVVGPYASEMISAATAIVDGEMRVDEVRELVFPHPAVAEIMRDTVLALH